MSTANGFSPEQQHYLQGFALGADVARKVRGLPIISGGTPGESITLGGGAAGLPHDVMLLHREAQDRQVAAGGKLVAEEQAKRDKPPADMWDELAARSARGEFPKGTDVFLTKFYGLFHVAPAQDSFMCRLRFPGGAVRSWQLRGLADLADRCGGGHADVTTRANLQLREIGAGDAVTVVTTLRELGIINYGAGADNVRNVTASPLSGFDPTELIETLPLAKEMHYHLVHHRELFGLPRKFNIAFEGGGAIASLEDTNDIGFSAVRVPAAADGDDVQFLLTLGGITGHKDFARPTGVVLAPSECVAVASAILKVYLQHGDRTDRKRARLKYLLDDWGFEKFIAEVERELGRKLPRLPLEECEVPRHEVRQAHVGIHPQKQPGLSYVGVVLPVGRMTSDQLRGLAAISERYGDGELRLTVWQNLLIPNIPSEHISAVHKAIEELGLEWQATSVRAGLVACTGSAGCKYAGAPTKQNALTIADYVEERLELDVPVNIHLTGCHHSCAQHYIGDIGLIATTCDNPDDPDGDPVEGYHVFVGGGYGERQGIGRELFTALPFSEIPARVTSLLQAYLDHRESPAEQFVTFTRRQELEALRQMCCEVPAAV